MKLHLGMLGAKCAVINAFVLAGLPTTTTLTFLLANFSRASPYSLKILALADNKSFLSIPGPLGLAPTNIATSHPLNPSS